MQDNPWSQPQNVVPGPDVSTPIAMEIPEAAPMLHVEPSETHPDYPGLNMAPRLFFRTRILLRRRDKRLTYERIKKDTQLKPAWLSGINSDARKNYALPMVEKLFHYLYYMEQNPQHV